MKDTFYMPAEWEPHDAVWFGWEQDTTFGYYPVVADVIKSIAPHVTVKIAVDNDSLLSRAKARLSKYKIDPTLYKTYVMEGDRYWIRDHGAAFLINEKGELGVLLPTYTALGSSKEKEDSVRSIFEKVFPKRKIIFIDAMPLNWSGGGIHCSTQQQPTRK